MLHFSDHGGDVLDSASDCFETCDQKEIGEFWLIIDQGRHDWVLNEHDECLTFFLQIFDGESALPTLVDVRDWLGGGLAARGKGHVTVRVKSARGGAGVGERWGCRACTGRPTPPPPTAISTPIPALNQNMPFEWMEMAGSYSRYGKISWSKFSAAMVCSQFWQMDI